MKNVEYLGDGLYAAFDGYQICLMANSHTEPTDMVYLDPHVYSSLQKYVSRVTAQQSVQPTDDGLAQSDGESQSTVISG